MKKYFNFYLVVVVEAIIIALCTFLICDHFMVKSVSDDKVHEKAVQQTGNENSEYIFEQITESISSIQEFNTAKYSFSCQQTYQDYTSFKDDFLILGIMLGDRKIPGTETSFTYLYKGYVNAGIDFTKVVVEHDDSTIYIKLPKAEILGEVQFNPTPQLIDEKKSVFNPLSSDETTQAHQAIKDREKQNAIEYGLLDDAEKNAETIIRGLLNSLKPAIDKYKIEISFNK